MNEEKLNRLRKLWLLARGRGNKFWMGQIEADARKLKAAAEEEDLFEKAKEIFYGKAGRVAG